MKVVIEVSYFMYIVVIKYFHYMYGENGEPWLSMRLWYWEEKQTIDVWAYFLTAR